MAMVRLPSLPSNRSVAFFQQAWTACLSPAGKEYHGSLDSTINYLVLSSNSRNMEPIRFCFSAWSLSKEDYQDCILSCCSTAAPRQTVEPCQATSPDLDQGSTHNNGPLSQYEG